MSSSGFYPPPVLGTDKVNTDKTFNAHTDQHNSVNAAMNIVIAELGANPSGDHPSVTDRLDNTLSLGSAQTVTAKKVFAGAAPTDELLGFRVATDVTDRAVTLANGHTLYGDGTGAQEIEVGRVGLSRFAIGSALAAGATVLGSDPLNDVPLPNTRLSVLTAVSGISGVIVRGASSQVADLQQWQAMAGTALSRIDKSGNLIVGVNGGAGAAGGAIGLADASPLPSVNPSSGGIIYSQGGLPFWRSASGVVSQLSNGAGPGLTVKDPVRIASLAPITLSGLQTIQGVVLNSGDRVLLGGQASAPTNGIYVVASGSWSRATDADSVAEMPNNLVVMVREGYYADQLWTMKTDGVVTLGVTDLSFDQITVRPPLAYIVALS